MNRVQAVYARQSVDKKDSISIETQIDYCRREAAPGDVLVYEDRGFSGSNTNRPAFRRLLEDIRAGRIGKVIIYKLDRMSRSLLDFAKLIEFFSEHQVEFQSTQEKFDTATPIGRAMLSITMVFAQLERETIQQRIRDNYYSRGEKGMYLGGRPPFGYRKEGTRVDGKKTCMLAEDSDQARVVRRIFALYAAPGRSIGEVGRLLNAEGTHSAEGKTFYAGNLNRILRNPVYVRADADIYAYYQARGCKITNPVEEFLGGNGCFLYGRQPENGTGPGGGLAGRTLSIGLHEGLVGAEAFLRAQQKLDAGKPFGRLGTGAKSWLAGLMTCGACGCRMSVKSSIHRDPAAGGPETRYAYFSCNGRRYGRCGTGDAGRSIPVEAAEQAVEARLLQFAAGCGELLYRCVQADSNADNELKIELLHTEQEIQNLVNAVAEGGAVTGRYLEERLERLDREKKQLERELCGLRGAGENLDAVGMADLVGEWPNLGVAAKRRVAGLFISGVRVLSHPSGVELEITWKFRAGRDQAEESPGAG